ncbi:hypothetical protein [Candidatus Phyllobacterium onerii]|uniref:hypothetical protein n=1 Tax=Candidatus Phyllobacterium onerii TaxID=3020828 RepID=UPI00232E1479|nr:hypothetical protein [Phyllobacterium sp. IY22]
MRDAVERAKQAGPKESPLQDPWNLYLPMMVTFHDAADPLSVQKVDPLKLTATFGPGYALKAIIIEATDEPLSENLGQHLPWFDELWSDPKKRQCALDGNCVSYSVHPFMIGGGHLKREK